MIMENKEPTQEPEKNEQTFQLEPEDMFKCFYALVRAAGQPVVITRRTIEEIKDTDDMNITCDKTADAYIFSVPKKRKRGQIFTPSKRIITH